jgi:hypothetical protein
MKLLASRSFLLAFAFSAGACSPGATMESAPATGENETGTIGANLTLVGGGQIATITYTVNLVATGAIVTAGSVPVANSVQIFFEAPGIPAAPAGSYTITLTGADDAGDTCLGQSAPFGVVARQETSVLVELQCHGTETVGGSATVTGVTANCATWQSVATNPGEAVVGQSAFIAFMATAPDKSNLTYTATVVGDAGANVLSPASGHVDAAGDTIAFQCESAGAETVQISFSDGPVPNGITCDTSLDTVQVAVRCDNGPLAQQFLAVVAPFGDTSVSQTEMRFLNRDLGRNDPTFTCTKCLLQAGCLDAPSKNVKGRECDDMTGSGTFQDAGATSDTQLCLDTLACTLAQSTDAFNSPVPAAIPGNPLSTAVTCANSGFPDACYCGTLASTAQCLVRTQNTGTCEKTESEGLGLSSTDAKDIVKDYTDTTRPSGVVNTIFACAATNTCTSCLQ